MCAAQGLLGLVTEGPKARYCTCPALAPCPAVPLIPRGLVIKASATALKPLTPARELGAAEATARCGGLLPPRPFPEMRNERV